MKSILLSILWCASSLYGVTLDEVIINALETNPSLASISHRISANESNINVSNQFTNPDISYSQNTIDENQAMSRRTVTVKQKLPYFGKRESLQNMAQKQENFLQESLEKARVTLVYSIKTQAYRVWELERLYKIICDYEDLTRQNISLFESYTMTSDNQHMGIMSAELTLSDLRIQKSSINAKINSAYAKLSYLAAFEIRDLDINLELDDMQGSSIMQKGLVKNHDIALKDKEIQKTLASVEMAELDNHPDVSLIGGYSYRKNFDNYWTFGLGMSLPIYGSESYKEEEARRLVLSAKSMKEDVKTAVNAEFQSAYSQMKAAYETYHIVHDEALPQVAHMFELTSSSISTGGDLFKYIGILVQKLQLEQKSISAVASYNRAKAKISELSGELQ